jgi:hypothetical protein
MLNKFIVEPADLTELSEAFEAAWVIVEAENRIPLTAVPQHSRSAGLTTASSIDAEYAFKRN